MTAHTPIVASPLAADDDPPRRCIAVGDAASRSSESVLRLLRSSASGLTSAEAQRRHAELGPNAVRTHHAQPISVLARQLRSPLLLLLAVTAVASFFLGERADAVIIGAILATSVGLGFANEYRAERAAEDLHSQLSHRSVVRRDGRSVTVDVTALVPGDVVELRMGEVVPADLRLLSVVDLECEESVLTGEAVPVAKATSATAPGAGLADLTSCGLMGTIVHAGSGTGVVVATGGAAAFGSIAAALGTRQPQTQFQVGLRRFSMLLVQVAAVLTTAIFVVNVVLHRPILDALLFSLAIAVGISPQLLPAVVSTSLAAGSRQLARRKVLVKRLVCIEDLGDITVLFTDKTGTLTDGHIRFVRGLDETGAVSSKPLLLGLLCSEATVQDGQAVGGNALDVALWSSPEATAAGDAVAAHQRLGILPFDHDRRMVSVVIDDGKQRRLVAKGAPEAVLARCTGVPAAAEAALDAEFRAGNRVIAVASRSAPTLTTPQPADEAALRLDGFLVFLDPPKPGARKALGRLRHLGIAVKVVTGDNAVVAAHVCRELGVPASRVVTGGDIDAADDVALRKIVARASVFARVSPEHKARIVRAARATGDGVAFLGDGVNDALALHAADVGISVDSATDVARDAADVILLKKDLDVLADGVIEGRRIFTNTIKYVFMGTSSNFGNMFSAAGASAFLSFLPMLPSQILLNNLLYDASQLAIPTDNVDEEQLARPSHWDMHAIRRFMLFFGPISSVFDFVTFAVMLWVFHAHAALFRSGWFVESLATQTLVIFAIRTRRIPFVRSAPSRPLLASACGAVVIATALPFTPLAHPLGLRALPAAFFVALVLMVACYLVLIEIGKARFFAAHRHALERPPAPARSRARRVQRRAARFSVAARSPVAAVEPVQPHSAR